MPTDSYTFRVMIEGGDAVKQAQEIRRALATEFKQVTTVLSLGNLPEAQAGLEELRKSARGVGIALTGGFRAAVGRLITDISTLQEQVNMVVRAGAGPVQQALDELGVMGLDALGMVDTGTTEATQKMARLTTEIRGSQAQIDALQKRVAELGARPMIPAGSMTGEVRTLDALFKEMTGSRMPQVRRMFRDMATEMGPVAAQLEKEAEIARAEATPAYERLKQEVLDLQAGMQKVLQAQGELAGQSQAYRSMAGWKTLEEEARAYQVAIMAAEREMSELRSVMMGTAQGEAYSQLQYQQKAYLEQLSEASVWWKELTSGAGNHADIVAEVTKRDREAGAALAEMIASWETIRNLQTGISRGIGTMQRMGDKIELPPGTSGTLATLVIAEKSLGESTRLSTDEVKRQRQELTKLSAALEAAAQQADGLDRVQRKAMQRLQMVGERELVTATKERGITTEEAITRIEPILVRVAQQTEAIKNRTLEDLQTMEAEGQRKQPFGFIVRAAQEVKRLVVGQSIIPDMVTAINEWLTQIGVGQPFTTLAQDANQAAQQVQAGLQARLSTLTTEQAQEQLRNLREEIRATSTAIESQLVSTGEASQAYKRSFAEYASEVQRVRGDDPAAMSLIAQGKVLRGTSIKGEFKTMEIIDEGYQAIQTQVEERQRLSQEEQARLLSLETRYTALRQMEFTLDRELAERRVASLEKAMGEALDTGDVDRFEALNAEFIQEQDRLDELLKDLAFQREMITSRAVAETEEALASAKELARRTIPTTTPTPTTGIQVAGETVMPTITQTQVKNALAYAGALDKVGEAIRQARGELPLITEEEQKRAEATAKALARAEEEERRLTAVKRQQLRLQEIDHETSAQKSIEVARGEADAEVHVAKALSAKLKAEVEATAYEKKQQARAAAAAAIEEERRATAQLKAEEARRVQDHQNAIRKQQQADSAYIRGRVQPTAAEVARYGGGMLGAVSYGVQETQAAQMGIRMLSYDVQNLGRSLTIAGAAMTGPSILATRRFIEYTRGTDRSARAMGLAREQSEYLREAIIEQSEAMALASPEDISRGMYLWVTGVGASARTVEELNAVMQQTVPIQQMAYMQQIELATATEATAGIMAEYRMEIDQTARVVEVLNATADRTFAQVEDLAEAFKFVGPIAYDLGISMEETAAAFGILADANIRGSMAGRAMRQILASLADATDEENIALNKLFNRNEELGQSWKDLAFPNGQFIGLARWVDLLAAATENLSAQERSAALAQLATANELPALTAMVTRQIEARQGGINIIRAEEKILTGALDSETAAYAAWEESISGNIMNLEDAHSAHIRKVQEMEESEAYRLDQMQRKWDAAMLALGQHTLEAALPALVKLTDVVSELSDFITANPWVAEAILAAGGTLAAAGLLATSTAKMLRIIMVVRSIGSMIEATKAAHAAQAAAAAAQTTAAAAQNTAAATQVAAAQTQATTATSLGKNVLGLAGAVGLAIGALKLYQIGVEKAGIPEWQQTQMARGTEDYGQYVEAMKSLYGKGQMETLTKAQWEAVHAGQELADVLEDTGEKGEVATHDIAEEMKSLKEHERAARREAQGLGDDLMQLPPPGTGVAAFTQEELDAIDELEAYLEKRNDMIEEQNDELIRMEEEFEREEEEHYQDYLRDRDKLLKELEQTTSQPAWEQTEEYRKSQEKLIEAQAEATQRRAEIEEDYRRKMRDLAEDHGDKMEDLEAARDAKGILSERTRYARSIRDAQEQRQDQLSEVESRLQETREEEEKQLAESREERRKEAEDKLAELDAEYQAEAIKRQADYDRQREERLLKNQQELQDLQQNHAEKLASIMGWEEEVRDALRQSYVGREMDLRNHLAEMERLYKGAYSVAVGYSNQVAGLYASINQRQGEYAGMQSGGYALPGTYRLAEAGREFVVNAPTTRALEHAIGPLTQGRLAQMAGGGGYNRLDIRVVADQHFSPEFAAQTEALVQQQIAQLATKLAAQNPAAYRAA